jgi:hypothetical protein
VFYSFYREWFSRRYVQNWTRRELETDYSLSLSEILRLGEISVQCWEREVVWKYVSGFGGVTTERKYGCIYIL